MGNLDTFGFPGRLMIVLYSRIGDQIQFNNCGTWYTVAGPIVIGPTDTTTGNSEQFINIGPPGTPTNSQEFLYLVNGRDDNGNGWIDDGFDGIDNNGDGRIDEPAEWEVETLTAPIPVNTSYTIRRRPVPATNAWAQALPPNMIIDGLRSRLPVNLYTGAADILVQPDGTVFPSIIYSAPSTIGMGGAFMHCWLAERADVGTGQQPAGQWSLLTISTRTGRISTVLNPDPATAFIQAQQGP
jgi:hypothetical protein